ncbi:unnamed protein product [Strongylus vulgaris]|uniref:Uncharacterized protein n=1 Tax=Strongylus vulgaris TaxID=40348 RepID=A0A3P7K3P5_STRVU|nr:unnamed protein product [Strongylus vulgaris]
MCLLVLEQPGSAACKEMHKAPGFGVLNYPSEEAKEVLCTIDPVFNLRGQLDYLPGGEGLILIAIWPIL